MSRFRKLAALSLAGVLLAACSSDHDGSGDAGVSRLGERDAPGVGSVATARPGDLVLRNDALRAVVQERTPSPWILDAVGGHLVDLERVRDGERSPDLLKLAWPVVQFRLQTAETLDVVGEGVDARVRAEGKTEPFGLLPEFVPVGRDVDVQVTTEYWIEAGARHLTVETRVQNLGRPLGDNVWLMDLALFAGEAIAFGPGRGGELSDVEVDLDFLAARTPEGAIALVPDRSGFTLAGSVSGVRLLVYSTDPLPTGGSASYRRFWIPGRDLADVLEEVYEIRGVETGRVTGRVRDAGGAGAVAARVRVRGEGGSLVSEAYTDADGSFDLALPPGRYAFDAAIEGSSVVAADTIAVAVDTVQQVDLRLPAPGTLRIALTDGAGTPLPAELLLSGPSSQRLVTASGELERDVAPGNYSLVAMRGPEYTLASMELVVAPGETVERTLVLDRVVDTTGWIAADLHLHSARSPDGIIAVEDRVAALAATGLEWVIATDHDVITDYDSTIAELGLGAWLSATPGQEISTTYYGHFNAFPIAPDPARAGNGAVSWYFQTPAAVFERVRAASPGGVLQANHARKDRLGGYFEAIAFDPVLGVATRPPEEVGAPAGSPLPVDEFQAIEVFNDKTVDTNEATFRDYTGLLDLGLTVAMTGNSDSHSAGRIPGFPRTYIRSSTDDPAALDRDELVDSLRSARVVVSGGLFLDVAVQGAGPGSVVSLSPAGSAEGTTVTLDVRVQAAPWVDARRLEVLVNGEVLAERAIEPSTEPVRFDEAIALDLTRDAWVIVRASGDAPMVPWKARSPYGASNPIWIDLDGNGRFDAR